MEQIKEAKAFIKKAIKRQPNEPSLYNSLGNLLSRQNKLDEALNAYQTAIELNPQYPGAFNNLGNIYIKLNKPTEAIAAYQQAIKIDDLYPDAHFNLARIFMAQGKTTEAKTHAEKVLTITAKHAGALGLLGTLELGLENHSRAIKLLQKRIMLQPSNAEAYKALASAYLQAKDYKNTINTIHQALQLEPKLSEGHQIMATAYLMDENREKALMHFMQQIEQEPNVESLYNIGVILSDQQRINDAISYFQRALQMDPNHLSSHLNIAALYLNKQKINDAIKHYSVVQQKDPNNREVEHILHALKQDEIPESAPAEYLQNLFNQYAPSYDKHLQTILDCQVPKQLYELVFNYANPEDHSMKILDLGCGTGLCGELFQPLAKEMIGVDVSPAMLEIAQQKNLYNELLPETIQEALPKYHQLDLIIASDVFPYIGDLTETFKAANHALRTDGLFSFSIEKTLTDNSYQLQKNIRYAHNPKYIQQTAKACGFELIMENNSILRKQRDICVEGYIYLLKKT